MYKSVYSFVDETRNLLKLEKKEHEKRKTDKTLVVQCEEVQNALLGRFRLVLRIKKIKHMYLLPLLKIGQTVCVFGDSSKKVESGEFRGVVCKNENEKKFVVELGSFDVSISNETLFLNITYNEVTFKRNLYALDVLGKCALGKLSCLPIIKIAFENKIPEFDDNFEVKSFFNGNLNESQKEAVRFSLSCESISLILGPPGTGKTTVVSEIVKQALINHKLRVLVSCPSNIAVDNVLLHLSKFGSSKQMKIVRVGHPARVKQDILNFTLDYLVNQNIAKESRLLRREIEKNLKKIKKIRKFSEKKKFKREIRRLKRDLRIFEKKTIKNILDTSKVVLSTLSGSSAFEENNFDLVIIDECAQALEAITKGKRVILVGDPKQLGPTILNEKDSKKLSLSLMERLYMKFPQRICKMLKIQYRMHKEIMEFSSNSFYGGELIADSSVESVLLCDLEGIEENEETLSPLYFIDTSNCRFQEEIGIEESKLNKGEASLVEIHLCKLLKSGVKEKDIGIISFYSAQVQLLKNLISTKYPFVEVRTVDGFQGREKQVIIISCVRSNDKGEVGFLKEVKRINVGYTRGKHHVCVIGDSLTLKKDKFFSSLVKYLEETAYVRFAEELLQI